MAKNERLTKSEMIAVMREQLGKKPFIGVYSHYFREMAEELDLDFDDPVDLSIEKTMDSFSEGSQVETLLVSPAIVERLLAGVPVDEPVVEPVDEVEPDFGLDSDAND